MVLKYTEESKNKKGYNLMVMKIFLKKNWGMVVLALILISIVVVNFKWGYFVLGNDNFSPEESPGLNINKFLLSPAWRSYRGLGVPSDSEQVDIFRSIFFGVFSWVGVPLWFISQMSVWVVFVCGPWFLACLSIKIFERILDEKKKQWMFLSVGIFYFTNMLTLWLFFSPLKPFIFVWGFLPFFLWASWNFFEKSNVKSFLCFLIALIGLSLSAIIPTIFLVELGVIIVFYFGFYLLGLNWKKIIFGTIFLILFQLFWLIPFGFYVKSNSSALADSYINRMITPGIIQDETKNNTLKNIGRYYTAWLNARNNDGKLLFEYSDLYKGNVLWQILSFVPVVLTILGIGWLFIKKKIKYLPLVFLFLGGIWMIKGDNWPGGEVYRFFQEKIPLFRQVFRWGSSKFWPLLAVSAPLLIGLIMVKVRKFAVIFLVLQLVFVFPIFKGQLINKSDWVIVPKPYYELKDFLSKVDKKGRVYASPEVNTLYFRNHSWGFFGSVFWSYFIPNPVMEKALVTGSYENETANNILVNAYHSQNKDYLNNVFDTYKIDWIISDKSLVNNGNGYKYDWDLENQMIENNPNLELVWQKDFLSVYKVNHQKIDTYENVYLGHDWNKIIMVKNFLGNKSQWISQEKAISTAAIYPNLLKIDDLKQNGQYLVSEHKYLGASGKFDWNKDSLSFPYGNLKYDKDLNKISVSILSPEIFVDNKKIFGSGFFNSIEMDVGDMEILTVNDQVWNFKENNNIFLNTDFTKANISWWGSKKELELNSDRQISVDNDSVISFEISGMLDNWENICFESKVLNQCLNTNISVSKTLNSLSFSVFLNGLDVLKIWIPENSKLTFNKIFKYEKKKNILASDFNFVEAKTKFENVWLSLGNLIKVESPIMADDESYSFVPGKAWVAEIFGDKEKINMINQGLEIKNKDTISGFYTKISSPNLSSSLVSVSAMAKNRAGIPLDLEFYKSKNSFVLWKERMGYLKTNFISEYFITPKDWLNYNFDVKVSTGGRDESVNELNFLFLATVPISWLELKLVPVQEQKEQIVKTINQAKNNYWISSVNGKKLDKVVVNGWEQGFVLEKGDDENKVKKTFPINWISWIGLALNMILVVGGVCYWRRK